MSQEKTAEVIDLKASRTAAEAGRETAGEFLANARQAAGLDLAAVSAATKIKIGHLEAIETSTAAALPATPYAVGFVKVYARFLGLDAAALAAQFKTDIGADAAPLAEQLRRDADVRSGAPDSGAKLASVFGVIAIVVFMIWAAVQIAGGGERESRSSETAGNAPGVTLKEDAAPPPQPKPSGQAGNRPAVAVTQGDIAPAAPAEILRPITQSETPPAPEEAIAATDVPADTAGDNPPAESDREARDAAAPAEPAADAARGSSAPSAAAPPIEQDERTARRAEPPAPVVVEARLTRSIAPRYPTACAGAAAALEKVTVIFDITAEGRTANARVVNSTNGCFNESALDALGRWRFDPRTVDGAPRPDVGKHATLNFRQ